MTERHANLPPILPSGTSVVLRVELEGADGRPPHPAGATGVIVRSPIDPTYPYRVRFADGRETTVRRRDMHVLKHFQQAGFGMKVDPLSEYDLWPCVIYRCVTGSRAYGLDHGASDVDRRGVYLPPADLHWSLHGVPEQLENPDADEVFWELEKFIRLALKANPNVLETLWTPIVEEATPLGQELREMRQAFLSRLVYQTFNGYAQSQFRKLEQDLRNRGQIKWKHAMHLLRLLLAGIDLLRTGELTVRVPDDQRDQLLAIRDGQIPWDQLDPWRLELHRQFEQAYRETSLPERPDYDRANTFLIKARRAALDR